MKQILLASAAALSLTLTPAAVAGQDGSSSSSSSAQQDQRGLNVSFPEGLTKADLGKRDLQTLAVQVMLDRSRHSPGVIDGYMGGNTRRAIRAYRASNGLPAGEAIDEALLQSLLDTQTGDVFRTYQITQEDVGGPWTDVPSGFAAQADLDRVGYKNAHEMLAERFHMDQKFLAAINPGVDFGKAGQKIVIVSHGEETLSGEIARIEVRRERGEVAALDADGKVLASYPATIGSDEFPSPNGEMEVSAIAAEANYTFDPSDQRWGPDKTFVIPPGPNNPIGGVWIDLGKDGYGIHGSPDPQLIGKTTSHGCVRLTNWDARELAGAVAAGVPVAFV